MNKQFISESTSGLANRIHCHASGIRMGRILGREVKIHWPLTEQLNVRFEDMFETKWPIVTDNEFNFTLYRTEHKVKCYNFDTCKAVRRDDPEDILYAKTWDSFKFLGEDWNAAYPEEVAIIRSLRPIKEVEVAVQGLLTISPRPLVGVHIRTCDIIGVHFCRGSTIRKENAIYAKGIEEFLPDLNVAINAGYDVFVASDDVELEKKLEQTYPGRVVRQLKGDGWRETVDGMREAMIDLYTLSQTRAILGTKFSQFSPLAAEIGGVPLFMPGKREFKVQPLG